MSTPAVKPKFSFFRLILAFVGLAVLVAGMALGASAWYFGKDAQTTMGKIVAIKYEGSDGKSQRPTFLFKDSNGDPHVAKTNIASTLYEYAVGDEIPILYNFRVADEVRIEGWLNNWSTGAIMGVIGLSLLSRVRRRVAANSSTVGATAAQARAQAQAQAQNPWQDPTTNAAGAKATLLAAIMQSAGQKAPVASVQTARAASSAAKPAPANRPDGIVRPKAESTVRRMR